ncbi:MAG: IMP cyclohydrolase [Desulfovibrionaceae bacterium]|nr:IMP cyclohydrolase [Desulfovibrionaceae bacterium]
MSNTNAPDLKAMYRTLVKDHFPDELTLTLGETTLRYARRSWNIGGETRGLRYGENPDQPAALYALKEGRLTIDGREWRGPGGIVSCLTEAQMIQSGKHPGKTNLTDVDNGVNILQYLAKRPAAVILKHNNPCGAAWSDLGLCDALEKAYRCDRIAAFGGAVVVNRPLDMPTAELIASSYFEVVAAPAFEAGTVERLASRKNLRVFELPQLASLEKLAGTPFLDIKSLADGGLVLQQSFVNRIRTPEDFLPAQVTTKEGVTLTARKPNAQEMEDLLFAWAVESGVTSNSVIFARNGATVAIGTGEQDRVGCVELATFKAYTKHADLLTFDRFQCSLYQLKQKALNDKEAAASLAAIEEETKAACGGLKGSVLVSDGFFPFRDGVDACMAQGVTAIAQPGGSIRDDEVIAAVNEATPQVAMVFTGQRSFKH